ncbi:MAG: glycosyltransferase family 2 protein, partial [Candidatus Thermoplasmatota archaeon]|nr:glycosyltransferase family 2 protein [Candidatus Thermoplasmatota archaeon]
GIVGCKLLYPNGRIQHAGARISIKELSHYGVGEVDRGQYNELKEVDYVTGAALMIKREVIDKIGSLDEEFSPAYFEEVDWCARARKAGYRVVYDPNATLLHYEGISKKKCKEEYLYFISRKNFVRFMLLHFPLSWIMLRVSYEARMLPLKSARKLKLFLRAYLLNLKNLREILKKRRGIRKACASPT